MSITTFIFLGILAVVIIPPLLVFVFCFLLGLAQSVYEIIFKTSKNENYLSCPVDLPISKKEIRARAGLIVLSRIEKDNETIFH